MIITIDTDKGTITTNGVAKILDEFENREKKYIEP